MRDKYEIDMCSGPLVRKLLLFSLPLMLSSVLQLLFNAADIVVVGRFSGNSALAAVGSTSSLIALFVNFFIGFSIGTNVLTARFCGAGDEKNVHETVHTSILLSIISGTALIAVGVFLPELLLELMGTPDDVLAQAALYLRIYFIGMPAVMVYNFGASILRAVGDTRRPLYYLTISGVINVVLNLFFVIVFRLGVAGVALATIISQLVSAALILRCLTRMEGMCRLVLRDLKIHGKQLKNIIRIGLPAGLQSSLFSLSNVLIQSSVNSFGSMVMAGNTAAANLEGFIYISMNSVYQANLSFTSQNIGAGNNHRITPILIRCIVIVSCIGAALSALVLLFNQQLLGIYTSDPQVISYGFVRLSMICSTYVLCGIMDVMVGSLRGMGYSVIPMIVSLTGACVFRIIWVFTIFAAHHTLEMLYVSYPISWLLTAGVHIICYILIKRRKYPS